MVEMNGPSLFSTSVMILFHFSFSFPSLYRHRHGMQLHFYPLELIYFPTASLSLVVFCVHRTRFSLYMQIVCL